MKKLTPSQVDALRIALERGPGVVYSSLENDLRTSSVASGSARVLVDRGLLADESKGALSILRITRQGRSVAADLAREEKTS